MGGEEMNWEETKIQIRVLEDGEITQHDVALLIQAAEEEITRLRETLGEITDMASGLRLNLFTINNWADNTADIYERAREALKENSDEL